MNAKVGQSKKIALLLASVLFTLQADITMAAGSMVVIESGEYLPLYKTAGGAKKVKVNAFLLDISQITNQDYKTFIQKNKLWNRDNIKPVFADENYLHSLLTNHLQR